MPKIHYVTHDGRQIDADAPEGHSVMEVAIANDIPGIAAECGGACTCATCHIYVEGEWSDRLAEPDEMEASMIDFALDPLPTSRLACQIKMSTSLDGLVVHLPKSQF